MPKIYISDFFCTQCASRGIPIPRLKGREREPGHLKKLYCLRCKKEINHVECIPGTKYTHKDFIIEYEYDNFTEEGLRKKTYNQLRGDIKNGTAKKKKTILDERSRWCW